MIIYRESLEVERHTARVEGAAVFNASNRSIWLDFAIFTPHTLWHSFATDIPAKRGRHGVTGDAQPFKRGDYAAIFMDWTGRWHML